jgi:Helix-turn-helix domain
MALLKDESIMDEGPGNEANLAVEAVRLAQWRRVVLSGEAPGLTLAEAAAVLGVSVESVRRRTRSGQLFAYRNAQGAIRIAPLVGTPEAPHKPLDATRELSRLWDEFKATRLELDRAFREHQVERHSLTAKLTAARREADFLRSQLQKFRANFEPGGISGMVPNAPRERIQAKLVDIREMAKRRKRPWELVTLRAS